MAKKLMSCLRQELNPRYHSVFWLSDVNQSALGLSFGHFNFSVGILDSLLVFADAVILYAFL